MAALGAAAATGHVSAQDIQTAVQTGGLGIQGLYTLNQQIASGAIKPSNMDTGAAQAAYQQALSSNTSSTIASVENQAQLSPLQKAQQLLALLSDPTNTGLLDPATMSQQIDYENNLAGESPNKTYKGSGVQQAVAPITGGAQSVNNAISSATTSLAHTVNMNGGVGKLGGSGGGL